MKIKNVLILLVFTFVLAAGSVASLTSNFDSSDSVTAIELQDVSNEIAKANDLASFEALSIVSQGIEIKNPHSGFLTQLSQSKTKESFKPPISKEKPKNFNQSNKRARDALSYRIC